MPVLVLMLQTSSAFGATLDELISRGLTSYPSILSRQSNRDAASTDLTASKLRFLPSPSVSTQRNRVANNGGSYSSLPTTTMTISQPLLLDGGVIAGYKKADAKLSVADFMLLETREEISKRIIGAYSEWFKAYRKILALEESVTLHEKFVNMITRRFEQGVASGADKDLGISRLMQARADLDTQRSIEETALTSLSELIGEPIHRNDLVDALARPVEVPLRAEGISRAQMQSVSVQRYKYEAEAAEQEAKEIRAQALPQLSFQAQRQVGNTYVPGAPSYNTYGVVLNYVPGSGFASAVAAGAAFERAKAALFQIDTAKRELGDRLNADYNEYEFALLRKQSLEQSVLLATGISGSYDRQYLVGRKSWLDLMNAVREQAQTKVQYADVEGSLLGASRRIMINVNGTMLYDVPPEQAANQQSLDAKNKKK